MKKLSKLFALSSLLVFTSAISTLGHASELSEKVDAAMNRFVANGEISGAVTMAMHEGEVIHFSAVGMADQERGRPMGKDTLFRIASLTKNYSSVLVKILEEQGKLSVFDKVETYLPEFKGIRLKEDDRAGEVDLRIWHLMSHTSGVDIPESYGEAPDLEAAAKAIAGQKLQFRPGTRWSYGKGMDVCGRIVEIVSGKKFDVFLKEQITDPLGMEDTAYYVDDAEDDRLAVVYQPDRKNGGIMPVDDAYFRTPPRKGVKPNPSSGLISSTRDVGVYYSMLLHGGVYEGGRIISEDSVKDLTRNWTGEMETNPVIGTAWGLGFGHIREPQGVTAMLNPGTYGHGGAYGTQAWVDPVTKVIYILMIQRTGFGNGDMSKIRGEFQRIVAENFVGGE
ncbi:MAG: serine hydrolase domain-containing protein [Luteolibacter sp.]